MPERIYTTRVLDVSDGPSLEAVSMPPRLLRKVGIRSIEQVEELIPNYERIALFRHEPTTLSYFPLPSWFDFGGALEAAQATDLDALGLLSERLRGDYPRDVSVLLESLDDVGGIVTENTAPSGKSLTAAAGVVTAIGGLVGGPVGIGVGLGSIVVIRVLWEPTEALGEVISERIRRLLPRH